MFLSRSETEPQGHVTTELGCARGPPFHSSAGAASIALTVLRSGSLVITRRLFGIQIRSATVALSRVAGIACSKTGFSERGTEVKVYYRLVVKTSDGASYIVGDSFVGYGEAMAGARRLAQLTGLKVLA